MICVEPTHLALSGVNTAYAGVDLHKSFCQAIVCTREGKVLKEGRYDLRGLRTERDKYAEEVR